MQWEYRVVRGLDFNGEYQEIAAELNVWRYPDLERVTNALGQEGWELVAIDDMVLFFKRPVAARWGEPLAR